MPVICMTKRCHSCKYPHTHTHSHATSSSSIENTGKHMHTYTQTNIQSKRTTDNRTWQAVNAPEARINYNFRFCWHSPRQIRQAKPIDWWIEPMTDGLTAWMTDVCVEFGLKVTYWWPHKRKVRNCQLGNRRKRGRRYGQIRGAFGMTLKPPSQVSFLWNNLEMSMQVGAVGAPGYIIYCTYTVTFTYICRKYCVCSWGNDTLEIRYSLSVKHYRPNNWVLSVHTHFVSSTEPDQAHICIY